MIVFVIRKSKAYATHTHQPAFKADTRSSLISWFSYLISAVLTSNHLKGLCFCDSRVPSSRGNFLFWWSVPDCSLLTPVSLLASYRAKKPLNQNTGSAQTQQHINLSFPISLYVPTPIDILSSIIHHGFWFQTWFRRREVVLSKCGAGGILTLPAPWSQSPYQLDTTREIHPYWIPLWTRNGTDGHRIPCPRRGSGSFSDGFEWCRCWQWLCIVCSLNLSCLRLIDLWSRLSLITLRELTMIHIMNALTDKPGWEDKVRSRALLILLFHGISFVAFVGY